MTDDKKITFSFGKNWKSYLKTVTDKEIQYSINDIKDWIGADNVKDKTVLDIGSGSGLHGLAFFQLGAKKIDSFDYDPYSVEATKSLWVSSGKPGNWKVFPGNVLDKEFLRGLGKYDIVYSWGVLHHTGDIWNAVKNAADCVDPGGLFWISLYAKGPLYPTHLALKKKYNASTIFGKRWMEFRFYIFPMMMYRLSHYQNPFSWNYTKERGMNVYHDIVDWLGGLPYEVASVEEVTAFCNDLGFEKIRVFKEGEGACSIYLFKKKAFEVQ
jgi:2-polyprenyl-6-hydroxyphenyl methylase/3-demethylubiquinone-9 3-methyltransferase